MAETALSDRVFVDLSSGRTAYLERGAGGDLVFVHGVGLNASVWAPQLDAFAGAYRVLAYDTLGHGRSALPAEDTRLLDYVAQLRELLDALAVERPVLIGHSMGALIATRFAIDYPHRVAGLVAANPVYQRPAAQIATSRTRVRELQEQGSSAALDEALVRWFGDNGRLDSGQVAQVRQWVSGADPRGYARAYRAFTEADPWLSGRLGGLLSPALFVTGSLDPNSTPDMARAMAAEAPRGQALVLEDERHMMAYASPERFNAVLQEFLDTLAGPDTAAVAAGRQAGRP